MGLDKLLKTLAFYLLSYTCIYIRRFLLFQPQHMIKVFFSSMRLCVETCRYDFLML